MTESNSKREVRRMGKCDQKRKGARENEGMSEKVRKEKEERHSKRRSEMVIW